MRRTTGSGRKRAVVVIGPFPPPVHGAALVTQHVAEMLRQLCEVHIANMSSGHFKRALPHHFTRLMRMCAALGLLFRRSNEIKSVYLSVSGGLGQIYDLVLVVIGRILGCSIFLHHHSFAYLNNHSQLFSVIQKAAGPSAIHICLCSQMAARLRTMYPRVGELLLVSNAALATDAQPHRSPRNEIVIGHMSNLMLEKGIETVLDAFRHCIRAMYPVQLVVAGPTHDRTIRDLITAAQKEFGRAFDYRGPVYGGDKAKFFQDIDIFLFPTRYENEAQPLVLFKSLAAGVPVIALARGCIADDLADGEVTAPDTDEFVRRVSSVVSQIAHSPNWLHETSYRVSRRARVVSELSERAFDNLVKRIASPDMCDVSNIANSQRRLKQKIGLDSAP